MAVQHLFSTIDRFDYAFFLTTITHNRISIFTDTQYANLFIKSLKRTQRIFRFKLYAYVLMPNHLHLLIRPKSDDYNVIPKIMKFIKGHSARYINQTRNVTGKLWQKSYFDEIARRNKEISRIINYIHQNPVTADLVESAEQYPYSSASNLTFQAARPSQM